MNTVRPHREALGWSRETLAKEAGCSASYIYQLESSAGTAGEIDPGLELSRRLSIALGAAVDVLFPPKSAAVAVGATVPAAESQEG